jgi:hypothetical protein
VDGWAVVSIACDGVVVTCILFFFFLFFFVRVQHDFGVNALCVLFLLRRGMGLVARTLRGAHLFSLQFFNCLFFFFFFPLPNGGRTIKRQQVEISL